MIRAADAALNALAPPRWRGRRTELTSFHNRRKLRDGRARPARRGKTQGPFDPRVPVLAVRGADDALKALLVSYACHNTTLSFYQWHGDYAGSAQLPSWRNAIPARPCCCHRLRRRRHNPRPAAPSSSPISMAAPLADAADRALAKR